MPSSPTHTRTWFRPKGWFTEREEYISTARILRDDPTKVRHASAYIFCYGVELSYFQGDMHNREALSLKRLWTTVCDYDLWPLYLMYVLKLLLIPRSGSSLDLVDCFSAYLPLLRRHT